jgi:hypothetical protein
VLIIDWMWNAPEECDRNGGHLQRQQPLYDGHVLKQHLRVHGKCDVPDE